jgi:hypothetical protein
MNVVRSKLGLLAGAVWCSFALMLTTMAPAQNPGDPLAPIAPLASVSVLSFDQAPFTPLNQQATAALRALEAARTRNAL